MEKKMQGIVPQKDNGTTLGHFLKHALHLTGHEISRAKFREKGILVNGHRRRTDARLQAGDLVEVTLGDKERPSENLTPSPGDIDLLYEDEDVIVLNKPAGILVHPSGLRSADTLADRLAFYLHKQEDSPVIRIFGRLDRDTSGVVLAAKNLPAATRLALQRKQGVLFKEYLAIAQGVPDPPRGTIRIPLAPVPGLRDRMQADSEGKEAVTRYETVKNMQDNSLLLLRPETGRTHQIRVHMSSIGHPLLGDPLYGRGPSAGMERTALHARTLRFLQPFTGEELQIEAPLPEDMSRIIF